MTIAACHVSPEGVILGTDSTSTVSAGPFGRAHYHDHEQKMFEVGGPGSTVAIATWGLGRIGEFSHRSIASRLGREHTENPTVDFVSLANRLAEILDRSMEAAFGAELTAVRDLFLKFQTDSASMSSDEFKRLNTGFNTFRIGYFLAGRLEGTDKCEAYEVDFNVLNPSSVVTPVQSEQPTFRGQPQIMERLIWGYERALPTKIMTSGKWTGTSEELIAIFESQEYKVQPHLLPLRDAIDWIHTVIHTTIRANKFSGNHSCGGPVEVGVITTDRTFRWVCHKPLDAAIITAQERSYSV